MECYPINSKLRSVSVSAFPCRSEGRLSASRVNILRDELYWPCSSDNTFSPSGIEPSVTGYYFSLDFSSPSNQTREKTLQESHRENWWR